MATEKKEFTKNMQELSADPLRNLQQLLQQNKVQVQEESVTRDDDIQGTGVIITPKPQEAAAKADAPTSYRPAFTRQDKLDALAEFEREEEEEAKLHANEPPVPTRRSGGNDAIDLKKFKEICATITPELQAMNEAHRAAAVKTAARRRVWFASDDEKLNEEAMRGALQHSLWVSDDLGYCTLENILLEVMCDGCDWQPLRTGDDQAYEEAKVKCAERAMREKAKIRAAVDQCVLGVYNKDFKYLQDLYWKVKNIDSPVPE